MKRTPGKDAAPLSVGMRDAARLLGISTRTLWSLTNQKLVPHYRVGAKILYPVEELKRWISDRTIGGAR